MDFNYTPEQEAYRREVRTWLEANQPPPLTDGEKENVTDGVLWERLKAWHKKLYHAGWAGLTWPKEYGGKGATFVEQVIFQQEMGRSQPPDGMQRARRNHDRPGDNAMGHRRAEEALPESDPER